MPKSILSKALISVTLLSVIAGAQVPVVAHLVDGQGHGISGSFLRFELWNCGPNFPVSTVSPLVIVQRSFDLKATGAGFISGQVIPNDQILCGNVQSTRWLVTAMKDASTPLNAAQRYNILSTGGTFDLGLAIPDGSVLPSFGTFIFSSPAGNQFITQPTGTTFTFKGIFDFTQATVLGISGGGGGGLSDPAANGLVFRSALNTTRVAILSDLTSLGLESTANKNQASGYLGLDSAALVASSRLGTGTPLPTTCLLGNQTWGACGVGGGATPGGLDTQVQFNDGGSALGGNSFLTFNKTTHNLTLPDTSVWGPAGITAPANALIALDGTYAGFTDGHSTGFRFANNAGTFSIFGPATSPLSGGSLAVFGVNHSLCPTCVKLVSYSGGGIDSELSVRITGAADQLNYTYAHGGFFSATENGVVLGLDHDNKSAHFFGPLNFPNGAGTGNSFGVIGAVPVSGGASTPTKWSSDLSGTYVHTGANGTCPAVPSSGNDAICYGTSAIRASFNGATYQDIVLANNIPVSGLQGLIAISQVQKSDWDANYVPINAISQGVVPEGGATGAGLQASPIIDDATSGLLKLGGNVAAGPGIANCSSTGTTVGLLAKYDTTNQCMVTLSTSDTGVQAYLITNESTGVSPATTGNTWPLSGGIGQCTFDGATTAGHYVGVSSSAAGKCTDLNGTFGAITGGFSVVGIVLSTNGAGGNYNILLSQSLRTPFYQIVNDNGTPKTKRSSLKFISGTNSTVSCADNSGGDSTDCTISSSGGGGGGAAGATLFSTTASTTVTAASATTLIGAVTGSTTIPVNTWTAGSVTEIVGQGYYTSTGARTLNIQLLIGGSARIATGAVTVPAATLGTWRMHCMVTTRTIGGSGTQIANCQFIASGATLTAPAIAPMQTSSTWTIDTTATEVVDLQATWDATTGAPTITATNVAAWIPGAPVSSVGGQTGAVSGIGSGTKVQMTGDSSQVSGNVLTANASGSHDSGKAAPTGAFVGDTDAQTLSAKTLTSPIIGGTNPTTDAKLGWDATNHILQCGNGTTTTHCTETPLVIGTQAITVNASTTTFIQLQGSVTSGTEATKQTPLPFAGYMRRLCVRTNGTQSSTGSLVFTFRDSTSASNSALVSTIAANAVAGVYCDSSDVATVTADHNYVVQIQNNATAASAAINGVSLVYGY